MQTEIKIVDEESKLINWKRLDYLMFRTFRTAIIAASAIFALRFTYQGLSWWVGV